MIGKRLKILRKENNLSQKKISDNTGISRSAYSNYEADLRKPPYEQLIILANYFEVSTDYLLGLTDIKTPIKKLTPDQKLISILSDSEMLFAFQDYDNWTDDDKRELIAYLKVKRIARKK